MVGGREWNVGEEDEIAGKLARIKWEGTYGSKEHK